MDKAHSARTITIPFAVISGPDATSALMCMWMCCSRRTLMRVYLIDSGAPLNPGNPYVDSPNQTGFGTFGPPHIKALLAEAATRALKAVWYQKWFVHRVLRPEAFGGLVHLTLAGTRDYPLHPDIL